MIPVHVTETDEPGPWTDCTWAAGLDLAQKATNGETPATRDEREALRRASGDATGGSSIDDLSRGTMARYGWPCPRFDGTEAELKAALASGSGALVQGLYSRLPAHHQRWDRKFAGKGQKSGHAAYVQDYRESDDTVLWFDPLARGSDAHPWQGERLPWVALMRFLFGLTFTVVMAEGQHAPAPPPAPEPDPTLEGEDEMFNIAPATTHRDVVLKPGTVLYRDSKLTRRHSRVDKETPLGFAGSGKAFHAVINAGNTNYVRRDDVVRIVANERTYS